MTEFDRTNWARAEFGQRFIEEADIYVVERRRMLEILGSFYRHFIKDKPGKKILDLGCGDGILTHELLKIDSSLSATLVDGSAEMLERAESRLKGFKGINYVRASVQEMPRDDILRQKFDFIISSLAIHHLSSGEKKELFGRVYSMLSDGGYFLNIDVVLAPAPALDGFYMRLWREWIDERKASPGITDEEPGDIIRRYKDNTDNKPDTLDYQVGALKEAGFQDVDCYYKYGIFTIYGGRKSLRF
ncbi:MAG: class I SAM-dependent methyltransferase [Nitrospiraceae bacterium]|nr:class I SAM-dependent methyltransferase [Nitrospiraceae bacterium]